MLLPTGSGESRELPGGGTVSVGVLFPGRPPDPVRRMGEGEGSRSYIQDVAGGPPRPFAEEGMRAAFVSPDGLEIAGATPEGLHLIYRADGAGRARLIEGTESGDLLVQWSADGKSIIVRGAEEQPLTPLTLYRVTLATGHRERWKTLAPADLAGFVQYAGGPTGIRVTPDGQAYVYSYYISEGTLFLIEGGKQWWR